MPRAVVGLMVELDSLAETESHRHRKAQLLYVVSGVITVEAAGGIWTVPPRCAIWTLASEVADFGIKVTLIELGGYDADWKSRVLLVVQWFSVPMIKD